MKWNIVRIRVTQVVETLCSGYLPAVPSLRVCGGSRARKRGSIYFRSISRLFTTFKLDFAFSSSYFILSLVIRDYIYVKPDTSLSLTSRTTKLKAYTRSYTFRVFGSCSLSCETFHTFNFAKEQSLYYTILYVSLRSASLREL